MKASELREKIIQKIMVTDDEQLLIYLNQILSEGDQSEIYRLTGIEKSLIAESQADKEKSNEEVNSINEEWLNE